MLTCSLTNSPVPSAKITRSLSGFTFLETVVPIDAYVDAQTLSLSTDDGSATYQIAGCDAFTQPDSTLALKICAVLESQVKYMKVHPLSYENAKISDALHLLGISGGTDEQITLLNLFLSDGQLAIFLANTGSSPMFVDFENATILKYADLYKAKPATTSSAFRKIVSRPALAGAYYYDSSNIGMLPDGLQAVVGIDGLYNTDEIVMKRVVDNYNELCRSYSQLQMFVTPDKHALGSTIVSGLTHTKHVIVGVEESWTGRACLRTYYCI